MKRRIMAITIFALLLSLFTACENNDKAIKGTAYIPVNQLFSYTSCGEVNYNGNDYESCISHETDLSKEYSWDKQKLNYRIAREFDIFWINNGDFAYITSDVLDINDNGKEDDVIDLMYSGKYNLNDDGKLDLMYKKFGWRDSYESILPEYVCYGLEDEIESQGENNLQMQMKNANDCKGLINGQFFTYIIGINTVEHLTSSHGIIPPIAGVPICIYDENWIVLKDNEQHTNAIVDNVYLLGDYIVAEQQGLSFESIKNHEEFSLKFEMPENATYYSSSESISSSGIIINNLYEDTVTKWNGTLDFKPGNVFEAVYSDRTVNGKWYLFDDHIVIIDTTNNKNIEGMAILYIDFDNQEVYIPGYAKCNTMLKYLNEKDIKQITD